MRIKTLAATAAAFAVAATPAVAAEQQTVSAGAPDKSFTGKLGSGFVYGDPVDGTVPACTPGAFDCEKTLVKVEDFGKLAFSITSDPNKNPALSDIDLHVYKSDAAGTQGAFVGESISSGYSEQVTIADSKSTAGQYYLVIVDWYLGVGDYTGRIKLTPRPIS